MSTLGNIGRHLRSRLVSGLFVLVPIGITVFTLNFVFRATASVVEPLVSFGLGWFLGVGQVSDTVIRAFSFVLFVILMYIVGVIATHILGVRFIALAEGLILRIPVIKSIYSVSKQMVDAISSTNRNAFKSVVLVEFPRPGVRTLGFVTGTVDDRAGGRMFKVFVPTAPNPTTGFLLFVAAAEIQETGMSVEEAFKMLISGGVISGDKLEI